MTALTRGTRIRGRTGGGDLAAAGHWADDAAVDNGGRVSPVGRADGAMPAWRSHKVSRDQVDERRPGPELACAAGVRGVPLFISWTSLECLGALAGEAGGHREAARLFGAADGHSAAYRRGALLGLGRGIRSLGGRGSADVLGEKDFDAVWAEGAASHRGGDRLRRSAAAANANAPPAAGPRSPLPSATW